MGYKMMHDEKTLLGQIEFLKECNARLYHENRQMQSNINQAAEAMKKQSQQISKLNSEIARRDKIISEKDSEIRAIHQRLEITMEYNKRLSDKINMMRDMPHIR